MFRAPITAVAASPSRQINILVASLTRGGAERIVVETAQAMAASGISTTVYVFSEVHLDYPVIVTENLTFKLLKGNRLVKLRSVALDLGRNASDIVQTHLIEAADLEVLWSFGIKTIPVVHNARPGWRDAATSYNHPNVPVVIAVADTVAKQLKESGLQRPTLTIRHEIQRRPDITEMAASRKAIRRKHDIRDDVFLIGMVGQFKMQKAYTRAIRLLAEIQKHMRAKLLIIGSWDHDYGSGRTAYQDAIKLAVELGVVADVITPGNLDPVEPYYSAFDVFLNTSIFEGLSISLLEAIGHGCRIVAADAGGASEILPPGSVLVENGNDIQAYLTACIDFARQSRREIPAVPAEADVVMRLWSLLAPSLRAPQTEAVLFLTKNLRIGGPARALINLLRNSDADCKWIAGVIGDAEIPYVAALTDAQIPVVSAKEVDGLAAQAELVIHWLRSYNFGTICFWNVGPELKLLLTKLLSHEAVRLIDVSPGPMLFDDINAVPTFQKRIAFSAKQYFSRLDHFVGLYDGGLPDDDIIPQERKSIIPCGVPVPPAFIPLPQPEFLLPEKFEANLAIGTCCRIVPDKKLEFLLEMIDCLTERIPGVSLTVVGGPDASSTEYYEEILENAAIRENVRFIGPQISVQPYLQQFQVFVMVSDRQGCPNASLEAMAMGIPVVANPNGGTEEQVINGVTGFIVETPQEMAQSVMQLLTNQLTRLRMGQAAREHVLTNFSIEGVASEYRHLLSAPIGFKDQQGDQQCSA
jgi:glycosyltransferase involved in cell wall biosynthesis